MEEALKNGRFTVNEPIVSIDLAKLEKEGIPSKEVKKYFPRYILEPTLLHYGQLKRIGLSLIQWSLRMIVEVFLRPRCSAGSLDQRDVNKVYNREADTYDRKHHFTTRGMDLVWRRMAGWFAMAAIKNSSSKVNIIDLCTGTGLTAREVDAILKEWGIEADIVGLDYNSRMLGVAKKHTGADNIRYVQGDATNLVSTFAEDSADAITQVFGIGGIAEPLKVFMGVLRILKPSGQFLMIDMHKPIPEQAGEWPFFLKWCRLSTLEMVMYEKSTLPIVLNRLWGWRDTTLCFYLLPLMSYRDEEGRFWGFNVRVFEQESQRWWFSLPLMPIGKIIVEKVQISGETARIRKAILDASVL